MTWYRDSSAEGLHPSCAGRGHHSRDAAKPADQWAAQGGLSVVCDQERQPARRAFPLRRGHSRLAVAGAGLAGAGAVWAPGAALPAVPVALARGEAVACQALGDELAWRPGGWTGLSGLPGECHQPVHSQLIV